MNKALTKKNLRVRDLFYDFSIGLFLIVQFKKYQFTPRNCFIFRKVWKSTDKYGHFFKTQIHAGLGFIHVLNAYHFSQFVTLQRIAYQNVFVTTNFYQEI